MNRGDEYFELLANEGFRPTREQDAGDTITFNSEGQAFILFVPAGEHETFVMLHQHILLGDDLDLDSCLSVTNDFNRTERGIRCWYDQDESTITIAYEGFYYQVADFAPFLVNLLSDLRRVRTECLESLDFYSELLDETESEESEDSADIALGNRPKTVYLDRFGATENKLRWVAKTGDATFDLYIPKWRVPKPWPERIAVSLCLSPTQSVQLDSSDCASDQSAPIRSLIDRVSEHTRTARFRPRGESAEWELGEPYIPYALLPDREARSLQIEVRWVEAPDIPF